MGTDTGQARGDPYALEPSEVTVRGLKEKLVMCVQASNGNIHDTGFKNPDARTQVGFRHSH